MDETITPPIPAPLAAGAAHAQPRLAAVLDRLGASPPQCLLLEAGREDERVGLAAYWAARLNCEARAESGAPCLACAACQQILTGVHRDLIVLDGRAGQIKIEEVRAVRQLLGEPPRGAGLRVVALVEAQALGVEAANALLKSMEEPRPGNVFVLTAPQRERLLPTFVSRSFVLTLAWPATLAADAPDSETEEWAAALQEFWRTGRGFLQRSMGKGSLSKQLAERVLTECRRDVARALSGQPYGERAVRLAERMDPDTLRRLALALDQAQEALDYRVSPALALDWLAVTVSSWGR